MSSSTQRFMASIDDVGDVVVISGSHITIGHRAAGGADLEFLGGVGNEHGHIALEHSFHAGLVWTLRLHSSSPPATVGARELRAGEAHSFFDGDEIRLGAAAEFRVHQPDPASASVVLELIGGTELDGARRVLLLAPGGAARARLGSRSNRHFVVPGLEADIEIFRSEAVDASAPGPQGLPGRESLPGADSLVLTCPAGVRRAEGPPDGATTWTAPLPLVERVFLSSGADPSRLPPFGIALRPLNG